MASMGDCGGGIYFIYRCDVYLYDFCLCDRARHTGHSDTLDVVWENRDFGTDSGGRPGNCIFGESGVHHSSKEN